MWRRLNGAIRAGAGRAHQAKRRMGSNRARAANNQVEQSNTRVWGCRSTALLNLTAGGGHNGEQSNAALPYPLFCVLDDVRTLSVR